MEKPATYWHMLPEAAQARKAIWEAVNPHTGIRRIDEAFPHRIRASTREHEMAIRFVTGSTWQVVGSDNYDSLVGSPPFGVVFSEWALANPAAWAYIRPILRENGGWAAFLTTPRGKNHAYNMYEAWKDDPAAFAELLTVEDTGMLSPEQIAEERAEYIREFGESAGNALFEQEYYCNFDAAILGAYFGKEMAAAGREGRVTTVQYEPAKPVYTAWDIGVRDATAIWFFQLASGNIRVIDYYEAVGEGLAHYAKALQDKPYVYATHYGPHDLANTEWGSGKSRIETAKSLGLTFRIVPDVPLMDGINAARLTLPICWFDAERCATGIEALKQYRADWDEERRVFRDKPRHDWASHAADAFRYLSLGYREKTQTMPSDPLAAPTMGQLMGEHFRRRREARYG